MMYIVNCNEKLGLYAGYTNPCNIRNSTILRDILWTKQDYIDHAIEFETYADAVEVAKKCNTFKKNKDFICKIYKTDGDTDGMRSVEVEGLNRTVTGYVNPDRFEDWIIEMTT